MKNLQVRVTTDLTTEPVTVSEAKNFCHVTATADDTLFGILITAARQSLEKYTSSSFAEKEIYATWVTMPDDWILELPYGPVISVDKVYKIDEEGTEELLTINSDYYVYGDTEPIVQISTYWSTGEVTNISIRVEYTAGYGDATTGDLPEALKLAIMKQVATEYKFRDDISEAGGTLLTNESRALASPYRRAVWF